MDPRKRNEDDLRRWLRSHHDVISSAEARRFGVSQRTAEAKATRGEWDRMFRGIYRDRAAPRGPYQDLRGAYLATAGYGAISHASAAWDWGLISDPPGIPEVTVRLGSRNSQEHPGLRLHRCRDFDPSAAVLRNALAVTNPLRTIVDLAGSVPRHQLAGAVDVALATKLVSIAGLEAEIERRSRRGRLGVSALRDHLVERGFTGAPAPSVLEAQLCRLLHTLDIDDPTFELHVRADGAYRLDSAWKPILLAVEVDGYMWHFSPEQKRRDDRRRNSLQQAGWTVLVYSWWDIVAEPGRVAREIIETYRRLSPPG